MSFHLTFINVSFSYPGAANELFLDLDLDFSAGWTGIVGPNGSGKTTLLFLATGLLKPDKGTLHVPSTIGYCPQRTDEPPARLDEFLSGPDAEACLLASQLQVEYEWLDNWACLSHGERKRAQIAVALWENPEILAIDEPTNHIDSEARRLLETALSAYAGIGLIVSHDRKLLDSLANQCVFVDPPGAEMRAGNYSSAHAERQREFAAVRSESERMERACRSLKRELNQRQQKASRSHAMRSKRGLPIKDHDARFKINAARLFGDDGDAGRAAKQLEGRLSQLEAKREALSVKRETRLGIWIQSKPARNRILFDLPPGQIRVDAERSLEHPRICIERDSRISLAGPNGSGKSTLVRYLLEQSTLPDEHVLYLPQEISAEESQCVLEEIRKLPRKELGSLLTIVSSLGSRPERILDSELPSPGEVRKLLLARGIRKNPWLVVLDEPTNHLDLPSIECLETALSECPCALVLVSHDKRFLDGLATTCWRIGSQREPVLETSQQA